MEKITKTFKQKDASEILIKYSWNLAIFICFMFISLFIYNFLTISYSRRRSIVKISSNTQMTLTSAAFNEEGVIPRKYTCDGENSNPPFTINNVPSGTASLSLIVEDLDAPIGIFTHWMVWNIKPDTNEIRENSVPEFAVQGINSWDGESYGGPCPPYGEHRYLFTLYALDKGFGIPAKKTKEEFYHAINGHILSEARLMAKYTR